MVVAGADGDPAAGPGCGARRSWANTCGGWWAPGADRGRRRYQETGRTALEAMLADPMAGSLPYEHVVTMTEGAPRRHRPWLPQFAAHR